MVDSNIHGNKKTYIAGTQDSQKVATDKGVFVLEKLVMIVLNRKSYVAFLKQPGETEFYGKLHMDRVETLEGDLCDVNILIKASGLLAREGML